VLLAQRQAEFAFIVLFGSMARGGWSHGSDYDVLIGLGKDHGKRLLDRMAAFPLPVGTAWEVSLDKRFFYLACRAARVQGKKTTLSIPPTIVTTTTPMRTQSWR
jgi:predicted nucleotidyltransferase